MLWLLGVITANVAAAGFALETGGHDDAMTGVVVVFGKETGAVLAKLVLVLVLVLLVIVLVIAMMAHSGDRGKGCDDDEEGTSSGR